MRRGKIKYFIILGLLIISTMLLKSQVAVAKTILPTDVTTAAEGNALVGVEGSFATDVQEAIDLVNKYRLEACTNGYPNPNNPEKKLTKSDYVPIQWSSDLEYIARIRAAEASVYASHKRPKGYSCFSLSAPNGVDSCAEVLAWGGSSIVSSVKMWYSEKSTWVKQEEGVTGHYTSMISPSNTHMGMANFDETGAGEFTSLDWVNFGYGKQIVLDTTPLPVAKNVIQTIEVKQSELSDLKVLIDTRYLLGEKKNIQLTYDYGESSKVIYLGNISWSCNSNKIRLSADGKITPTQVGKYKITFCYSGEKNGEITKQITVVPKAPKITKVTMGKTSAKVKFTKVSGISGYEIRYGYGGFWNYRTKTIKVSKVVTAKQIKKLSRRTYYSFEIRAYKKVGKKTYYSDWSNYISKKTK